MLSLLWLYTKNLVIWTWWKGKSAWKRTITCVLCITECTPKKDTTKWTKYRVHRDLLVMCKYNSCYHLCDFIRKKTSSRIYHNSAMIYTTKYIIKDFRRRLNKSVVPDCVKNGWRNNTLLSICHRYTNSANLSAISGIP